MKNRTKLLSSTLSMINANFDVFIHSPRTSMMLLFIAFCCILTVRGYGVGLGYRNYTMNHPESLAWFVITGFNSFNLTSVIFLITISELPRQIPFQQYSVIRSSRIRWIGAQMLYCVVLTLFMLAVLVGITSILLIPIVSNTTGWSDTVRISQGAIPELSYIPEWIRVNLSPFETICISVILIFFYWLTMTWMILLLSLLGYGPYGVIAYSVLLMLDTILMTDSIQFSPTRWALFQTIILDHPNKEEQAIVTSILRYFAIDFVIGKLLFAIAKHADMPVYTDNKD